MLPLLKYFTPIFYFCYLLVVFVWPSVRTYRQTGVNPLTFGSSDNAHDFIGKWFKVLLAAIGLTIVAFVVNGKTYNYLLPAEFLYLPVLQVIGIILCIISLVWTSIAQWQMGKSWRIGIDEKNKTELKTKGLFSLSRNPIFLGLLTTLTGLFLIMPNAITLVFLVAGYLLIQIVIRLEEEFLNKQHGAEYDRYTQTVRRML